MMRNQALSAQENGAARQREHCPHILLSISLIVFCLVSACASAWAAPSISGVSGTISHGQSVTISGSSFGSKATAAPDLWDTVENQYTGLSDGNVVPAGAGYPWGDNRHSVTYETSSAQRHANGTAFYYHSASIDASLYSHTVTNNTGKIYVYWWFRPDSDPTQGEHSTKFLRASLSTDFVNKTFSWTQMHNYVYNSDGECNPIVWASYPGNVSQWNLHEVYIDGKNRTYTISVNGSTLSSKDWSECNAFDFDHVWAIGWDGDATSPSIAVSFDDIYIDNTQARVMIGNASVFTSCTSREIQIPSAWAAGEISITINQGSFSAGTAYLFVVDADGSVSPGYEITIGEGSPDPPDGVTVRILSGVSSKGMSRH